MKIGVIGAGQVGATTAFLLAQKELGDIVLLDIVEGMPQGKGLDMAQAGPVLGYDCQVIGTNDFADIAGAEVVVVTSGLPRKPGMSRMDLLNTNAGIVESVTKEIAKHAPDSFIVMVTNPLDVMCYVALEVSGFGRQRVFGMAGVLDSTRCRCFVAQAVGASVEDVQAMVLGGHGDSMVPLPRYITVGGIPIPQLLDQPTIDAIVERTRKGGTEIVSLLKTGSAYYAPGAAVAQMVESLLRDKKRLVPASAYCTGEYGLNDVYVGVPVVLGRGGMERIVEIELMDEERQALEASAADVKEGIEAWKASRGK